VDGLRRTRLCSSHNAHSSHDWNATTITHGQDYTEAYTCPGLLVVPGEPLTVEQALSVVLGHADACQRHADRWKQRKERAIEPYPKAHANFYAEVNQAKADSLRFAVERIRDLTQCGEPE
jgi:hypothetical protein